MRPSLKFGLFVAVLASGLFGTWSSKAVINLVTEGAEWKYYVGATNEPSSPTTAWRTVAFNDTSWPNGLAPIGYSTADPKTGHEASIVSTLPPGATAPTWTTAYFRKTFNLASKANITSVSLNV